MKKAIFITLAMSFAMASTFAQSTNAAPPVAPKPGAHAEPIANQKPPVNVTERAKQETDKMAGEVNLTKEQRDKIYDIFVRYHTKKNEIKAAYPDNTSSERMAKMQDLKKSVHAEMQGVLTKEQFDKVKDVWSK